MNTVNKDSEMKTAILSLTEGAGALAADLAARLPEATVIGGGGSVAQVLAENWQEGYDAFICIMAAGIVVRSIAPLLKDKASDPCVVVVDEKGGFAVSLLSGHLGGGNDLARQVADITDGQAVITTASDALGLTALDLWARANGLIVEDKAALTRVTAKLVNQGMVTIYFDVQTERLPSHFVRVERPDQADIIVSARQMVVGEGAVVMRPAQLVFGIGCNRNTPVEEISQAVTDLCRDHDLSPLAIRNLASIDLKNDEVGLLEYGRQNKLTIEFFGKDELNTVPGVSSSAAVMAATGAVGVAEPAALLSASTNKLLIRKQKWKNVTLAVAEIPYMLSAPAPVISNI